MLQQVGYKLNALDFNFNSLVNISFIFYKKLL